MAAIKELTVALVGNPNCGKTTLFNQLTGSRQKVGNWAGVTVEKKTGSFELEQVKINVVDLPGIYSLSIVSDECSLDERIACQFILNQETDLVVNIIDAANLKRNLYLTLQLLEMGIPCIIAVNMIDIAQAQSMHLDLKKLESYLGCPVLPLISHRNQGIDDLKQAILKHDKTPLKTAMITPYPDSITAAISTLAAQIENLNPDWSAKKNQWLALRLLEQDKFTRAVLSQHKDVLNFSREMIAKLEPVYEEELDLVIADLRYAHIDEIVKNIMTYTHTKRRTMTYWMDKIALHRFLGIPAFLAIMYFMFEFSMNIGSLLQPLFNESSNTIFVDGLNYAGHLLHLPAWLTAVLAHGFGMGINTILTFTPQIALLFLFLSFLEDSGYMARAAFVMDRFMQAVGLPGKSFIPLIVGFGCNVPSIMATRTLTSHRDRVLTAMMTPFMSCGARLAIFVVFATAFFPKHGGIIIFTLYLLGILIAMLTGFILKATVLKGETLPFILELPPYHKPHFKNIILLTWQRTKGFIIRAGKVILPVCILVGSLNVIQINGTTNSNGSKTSLLSMGGKIITPLLHPLGVTQDNWPATVGLLTGILAKEVVIGTLNTLYSSAPVNDGSNWQDFNLLKGLKDAGTQTLTGFKEVFSSSRINPFTSNEAEHDMSQSAMGNMYLAFPNASAAFAYLLFVLLYIPCISTMGVIAREIGKTWAYLSTAWSFSIAYTVAVIFYQAILLTQTPVSASLWIICLLIFQIFCFILLNIPGSFKRPPNPLTIVGHKKC